MNASDRRVLIIVLAAVAVLGLLPVAAFVGFGVWGWVSEPAHQLTLSGTHWAISQVGDDPAPTGPYALVFSDDPHDATLVLSCGSVPLWWTWDTEVAVLDLGVEGPAPSQCQTRTDADRAVLDAVVSTEGWRVESDTRIHLDSTPHSSSIAWAADPRTTHAPPPAAPSLRRRRISVAGRRAPKGATRVRCGHFPTGRRRHSGTRSSPGSGG